MKRLFPVPLAIVLLVATGSLLTAVVQDQRAPTLKELARQNGGAYKTWMDVQGPLGPLPKLAAEAELIVEGRIVSRITRLNTEETAVLTVFTLLPERVFKDKLQLGALPKPGPTEPLTFFEAGGTVEVDGLRITMTHNVATDPPLSVGDKIIGFFMKHGEGDMLRLHYGPYGLLRVRDGSVLAANAEVARYRPLEHTSVTDVRADIQRLVSQASHR
jgi:hypothetical protein